MELVTCACGWPVLAETRLRRVVYGCSNGKRPLIHRETFVVDAERCVCPVCESELELEPVFNNVGSGYHGLVVVGVSPTGVSVA